MEYSMNRLSKMSGVSTRTLRYYDEIGLLKPARVAPSGYRFYGQEQVDTLQQIMFYKELDFSLENIKTLLSAPDFDRVRALTDHLSKLQKKRGRLDRLILNVTKSLAVLKGEITMSDREKFEGFKQKLVDDNEQKYGDEIRARYGNATVDEANSKLMGLTKEQYDVGEGLRLELEITLKAAFETGNPSGELAQKACDLHRQWLCIYYPRYSKEYHLGLAEMYVADDRFRANYDKIAPGCTEFLRDAINIYCK
ncbi:MAG: MerR family transcriptional regulator [Bacillota bacterium]